MPRLGAIICNPGSSEPHRMRMTEHDAGEVDMFSRFLKLAGLPGSNNGFLKVHRGWLPYVYGSFLELRGGGAPGPPLGCDDLPFTAWTFPG